MKILNLGSLNVDKTYSVKRFVQPKETIQALKYEEFCGGKGLNQSVALARAGAEVYHAGAVGEDGKLLTDTLEAAGADIRYVEQLDGASGHAVIQIDEAGQNNIIICGGANRRIEKNYIASVLENFEAGDLILLQNEISNIDFAMEEAKKRGLLVAFNPSPADEGVFCCNLSLVDYFILNEVEGKILAGIESEEPQEILSALKEKYKTASIVLTLGDKGAYFYDGKETFFHDIYKVKAVDTTAAGDTFCGYFIAGLAMGLPHDEVLAQASAAGALAVTKKGAAPSVPVREAVTDFIKNYK